MGWLELFIICLIPGSIKLTREFGKLDLTVVPASFMLIEFLISKAKELLSSSTKTDSKIEEVKAS